MNNDSMYAKGKGHPSVFAVSVPADYDETDRQIFRESIREALKAIIKDADSEVKFQRTYRSMVDAGLGDHNSAGWSDNG